MVLTYYVYGHINPITKKFFYIGKGTGRRCYQVTGRNDFWHRTVNKYGFAVVKLVDGLTDSQSLEIEKQYIKKYGLRNEGGCLVNITYGGEGTSGMKLSDETREKMRIRMTGVKLSEETKAKVRLSKLGIRNPNYRKKTWNYGIPRTDELKRKVSATKTGVKQSEDQRLKSLAALEKAKAVRKEKMLKIRCLNTGIIWSNKWDCINSLGIKESKFKDMVRSDGRRIKKLEYLKM